MNAEYEKLSWGQKVAFTNKRKHGADFYERLGKAGGSTKTENTKNKGVASATPERRAEISRLGVEAMRRVRAQKAMQ